MKRIAYIAVALTISAAVARSQSGDSALARIRTEGLEHSQAQSIFDYLTINIGPRLTASPAHKHAAEWTRDRLGSYGPAKAHLGPWEIGRGWGLQKLNL